MTRNVLGLADKRAIADWLERNISELMICSSSEASERLLADTGIHASSGVVRKIARDIDLDVKWKRKPLVTNCDDGWTRDAILAKSIRDLYDLLDESCPMRAELTEIVARRTPGRKSELDAVCADSNGKSDGLEEL
jgi:hypothetical protein